MKKSSNKKAAAVKKKGSKKILIIAVAAALAVALAITGAVLLKKHIDNKKNFENIDAAVTKGYESVENSGESEIKYVKYSGIKMPEELAKYLDQAIIDGEKACKTAGVALNFNGKQISVPEFRIYYYETVYNQYEYVLKMEAEKGSNGSGFDYFKDPAEQNRPREEVTWESYFIEKAVDDLKYIYSGFEKACRAGTELTQEDAASIMGLIDSYKTMDCESSYGEGATYAIFAARNIMRTYATAYYLEEKSRLESGFTEAEITEKYNEDKKIYQVADVRVYPIESNFTEAETSAIKTEKQFLEFAENNFKKVAGDTPFDIDKRTMMWCMGYTEIAKKYGDDVADWIFEDERKAGEISVVSGPVYSCLIYIEKAKYEPFSVDVDYASLLYSDPLNAETTEAEKAKYQKLYDEWKAAGSDPEAFEKTFGSIGYVVKSEPARVGDFGQSTDMWLHKESRSKSDSKMVFDEEGAYIVVYLQANPEDFDWKNVLRVDMATTKFNEDYKKSIEENYSDVVLNDSAIEVLADAVNAQCLDYAKQQKGQ